MTETSKGPDYPSTPYVHEKLTEQQSAVRAKQFRAQYDSRRSVRDFSDRPVSRSVIEDLIMSASTAPSGANKQPWTFCAVSNIDIKQKIRKAAEKEEYENYHGRMSASWLKDLAHLGTDEKKPFLTTVPWIIVVFRRIYEMGEDGVKNNNYYVGESVGLATGFLLAAIHNAGLASLTHTPSPMNFLIEVLNRPVNEKPFLLIPVGYPVEDAHVPDIRRKAASQVIHWYE